VEAEWDADAERWVRWARTPGFDAYWYFRDGFFDSVMPVPGRRTLEIGCGEGRVARDLAARGHSVVAVEPAEGLARHARDADPRGLYARAGGARLPFRDASFDTVVAYNVLQVVDDMAGTVREAARVLAPGGALCACVAHPVTDLGRFTGDSDGRRLSVRARYFESERVEETVERDGHVMTFRGRTYSLEHYGRALERAGLRIEALREPRPSAAEGAARYEQWRDVPLFLNFRAVKAG
jgi:SAM-dependent methyltransferase